MEKETKQAQPPTKSSRYFAQYITITATGVGWTCDAQLRQTSRTRSGKGAARMRCGS